MAPRERQKLQPRSQQAQVNSYSSNPNRLDNPLEGFHMMDGRTDQFVQERNGNIVNDSTRDFWTASNPNTGTRYTSTNVDTPKGSYERFTHPSGFGQERYNRGDFNNFWLRGGGQDYYPGMGKGIGSLKEQAAVDPADWRNILRILEAGGDPGTETAGIGSTNEYQTAELTQDQADYMRNQYFSPGLPGAPTADELFNQVKEREDKGFFGWGAQEPTTRDEFDEEYNNLIKNYYA